MKNIEWETHDGYEIHIDAQEVEFHPVTLPSAVPSRGEYLVLYRNAEAKRMVQVKPVEREYEAQVAVSLVCDGEQQLTGNTEFVVTMRVMATSSEEAEKLAKDAAGDIYVDGTEVDDIEEA